MSTAAPALPSAAARPGGPLVIADGTIEALKWLGLALMTLDHVNKYLWHDAQAWAFAAGRLTMPIFGFVLAYNLARPGALAGGAYARTALRLAGYGLLASAPYMALGGLVVGWWPMNIMFTLLVGATVIALVQAGGISRTALAVAIFLAGGTIVEFCWYGVAVILFSWAYCRTGAAWALGGLTLGLFSLVMVNAGTLWAMAALPVLLAAQRVHLDIPRSRRAFYVYYPAHLAVLLAMRLL